MQRNLSAVYSGEYTQWNTRLHSLQLLLFMYKQMQDQGVRLGDAGALCYSWGLVFSRMPNDEYDLSERSFGDSLVWRRNYASGKRLNTLTFYWLGELASFSKLQDQAIKQMGFTALASNSQNPWAACTVYLYECRQDHAISRNFCSNTTICKNNEHPTMKSMNENVWFACLIWLEAQCWVKPFPKLSMKGTICCHEEFVGLSFSLCIYYYWLRRWKKPQFVSSTTAWVMLQV